MTRPMGLQAIVSNFLWGVAYSCVTILKVLLFEYETILNKLIYVFSQCLPKEVS